MTKDERFLCELYKQLLMRKDLSGVVNPHSIQKSLRYSDHILQTILKGLMQANLVRRYSPEEIGLTERGKEVAKALL